MKYSIFGFVFSAFFLNLSLVWAAAPSPEVYLYQKKLSVSEDLKGKVVSIPLDINDMQQIRPDMSNVQLLDKENNPVDFEVYTNQIGKKKSGLKVHSVSSKEKDHPNNMIDNDVITKYHFDKKVDQKGPSWVLIDLGEIEAINRVQIYSGERGTIRTYEIEAGNTPEDLKVIRKRGPLQIDTDFFTPRAFRYVKLKFWGAEVLIEDINFFISSQGAVYFLPQATTYKLLFGNSEVKSVRYKARHGSPLVGAKEVMPQRTEINPLFAEDFDKDGIKTIEDNCPLIKNASQKDADKDLVGDDCDNAPAEKNRYQYDTDLDNVGDIVDNCKFDQNQDQKDKDNDGFGDACDNAYAVEGDEKVPYFFYGILTVLVLGVAFLFFNEKGLKKGKKS